MSIAAKINSRLGRRKWRHAPPTERLGQAMRLAFGDDDVGMVEEPVDGRRCETLREDRVEAGRGRFEVRISERRSYAASTRR